MMISQFISALYFCQKDVSLKLHDPNQRQKINLILSKYKQKTKTTSNLLLFPFTQSLRIRQGKPVYLDLLPCMSLYIKTCSENSNIYTFDYDTASGKNTLVVEESKLDFYFTPGLYKCSFAIDAPEEIWSTPESEGTPKNENSKYLFNSSNESIFKILLVVQEYDGSPTKKSDTSRDVPTVSEHSLNWYIQDFKKTFNIQ